MTIYINFQPHEWTKARISYGQAIALSGLPATDILPLKEVPGKRLGEAHYVSLSIPEIPYKVKRGIMTDCGFLLPGSSVKVGQGMEFVVGVKKEAP